MKKTYLRTISKVFVRFRTSFEQFRMVPNVSECSWMFSKVFRTFAPMADRCRMSPTVVERSILEVPNGQNSTCIWIFINFGAIFLKKFCIWTCAPKKYEKKSKILMFSKNLNLTGNGLKFFSEIKNNVFFHKSIKNIKKNWKNILKRKNWFTWNPY